MGIKKGASFYIVCDNIRSLENIGSIFRTADALAVNKVFLCGISGTPPHPKLAKAALGAENRVAWEYYAGTWQAVRKLQKEEISIIALETGKKSLLYRDFKPKFPLALVVGNEIKGVSKAALGKVDKIISLPMFGKEKSLNVAVACGIAAYYINSFRIKPL